MDLEGDTLLSSFSGVAFLVLFFAGFIVEGGLQRGAAFRLFFLGTDTSGAAESLLRRFNVAADNFRGCSSQGDGGYDLARADAARFVLIETLLSMVGRVEDRERALP